MAAGAVHRRQKNNFLSLNPVCLQQILYITTWKSLYCFKTTPVVLPHSGPSIPV